MENNGNQQQKKDWSKKGLGWIPDYPDLRDYNLGDEEGIKNNLRFKIEQRTRDFEQFAEDLINLISTNRQGNGLDDSIEKLRTTIFGNVRFAKVKVHKLLREIPEDSETPNTIHDQYNPKQIKIKKIKYESILSYQIVELKKYLSILLTREYLSLCKSEIKDVDYVDFSDPAAVVKWMKKQNYDQTTKLLVKDFQHRSKIMADGIVGLETYITFNEYFSDKKNLSKLKNYNPKKPKRQQSLSKIKFFAVTSLISQPEFEKILDILKSKVTNQISKECEKYLHNNPENTTGLKEKIFEYDFLRNIDIENIGLFQEIFDFEYKEINIKKNDEYFRKVNDFINDVCSVNVNDKKNDCYLRVSNIVAVLQNSCVCEPIISAVIRIISPLAQWSNETWEEMILHGFEEFEKIANPDNVLNNSNIEPGYSREELVKSTILQVLSLLKQEIYSFLEEDNKDNSAIFLYFLLKKYLNQFGRYTSDAEKEIKKAIDEAQELRSNICDRQEVFEVELINYNHNHSITENNEQTEELFPSLDLYIPIITSNSYLKELTKKPDKKLFFLLPAVIDLSFWCSPVRDQGSLNSCTAFAAIALLEYFQNRNFGKSTDASPLFLYKAARHKMGVKEDVGASIRETIKVLALFGVPPEESWPYEPDKVDEEPPPYCYAYAQNYKTLKYFLLDYAGITTESLLFQVKAVLAAGFPCIFGLTLYTSVYKETNYKKGHIPYPDTNKDKVVGGHTAVVVGYDDYKFIPCADRQHYSRGAFLIRNSWGTEWGVNGYGWLPYDYILAGLTSAWWSLLKAEWFDESHFGAARPGGAESPPGDYPPGSPTNHDKQERPVIPPTKPKNSP